MTTPPLPGVAGLPRRWWFPGIGSIRPGSRPFSTYDAFDLDALPPIDLADEDANDVVLRWPAAADGLTDGDAVRAVNGPQLEELTRGAPLELDPTLERFIRDPEPRRRIRSVTACFLDLGEQLVPIEGGGALLHLVSDQQWVLHWFAVVPPDGGVGPVVVTSVPYGFPEAGDGPERFVPGVTEELPDLPAICADSFGEFLVRFLLENEAWQHVHPEIDGGAARRPELDRYLAALRGRHA